MAVALECTHEAASDVGEVRAPVKERPAALSAIYAQSALQLIDGIYQRRETIQRSGISLVKYPSPPSIAA